MITVRIREDEPVKILSTKFLIMGRLLNAGVPLNPAKVVVGEYELLHGILTTYTDLMNSETVYRWQEM
jgi:hypothetical protein